MSILEERNGVIAEAQRWLGTPYHPCARVLGVGVDCAMFPYEVYLKALPGRVWELPVPNYPPDWHIHQSEELYMSFVRQFATELPEGALPRVGDFVLYRWGRCYAHGAIIVDWPDRIIHIMREERVRHAEGNQGFLAGRKTKFFTLWPGDE